jgi:hypothetical protein
MVLSVRHDALDGLAMLTVLGSLLDADVHSSAHGLDPQNRTGRRVPALLARAWEVAIRPAATVAGSTHGERQGDAFATATVPGSPRTADLVHAGAGAVVAWNRPRAVRCKRVAVAVGVSTTGGAAADLADHSAFLRLRGVERLARGDIASLLARGPLQLGGFNPAVPGPLAAVVRLAFRVAAPRLGSTLLVSHLGTVTGPEQLTGLRFYPVTGGASGLSLGAATVSGRTTLTLRGRETRHDDEGLGELLALVVEQLERAGVSPPDDGS